MIDEPSSFQGLLVNFSSIFTEPSFRNFMALACGWALGTGRRTISRVIQVAGLGQEESRHHSIFYRFFSRARWEPDKLGKVILSLVLKLLPEGIPIILTVDDTLCRKSGAHFWGGGMHHDALYDPPPKKDSGRGRPRKKGTRLKSPKQLIKDRSVRWEPQEMVLYGRRITVFVKTQTCLWYTVAGSRPVRMIVTRDPKGRIEDRAYFSTDAEMTPTEIAQYFSLRWSQEEMHRNVKQHLGLEDPQNGWYREKKEPSFGDMLAALKRHLWTERNFSEPSDEQGSSKINDSLLDYLCVA